jgi:hypothetical protein
MTRLTELRSQLTGMLTAIPGPACPDPAPGTWLPATTGTGTGTGTGTSTGGR